MTDSDRRVRRRAAERAPEKTRERILAAGVAEFAEKGYNGARVGAIAARAGVNVQLIAYYFGGKEGLYQEINRVWQRDHGTPAVADMSFDQVVSYFVQLNARTPENARILAWRGLEGRADEGPEFTESMRERVADLRRRQERGELPRDLDADCMLLAMFAAASAGVVFPHLVKAICGQDADSPEFTERYAAQLALLIRCLNSADTASEG